MLQSAVFTCNLRKPSVRHSSLKLWVWHRILVGQQSAWNVYESPLSQQGRKWSWSGWDVRSLTGSLTGEGTMGLGKSSFIVVLTRINCKLRYLWATTWMLLLLGGRQKAASMKDTCFVCSLQDLSLMVQGACLREWSAYVVSIPWGRGGPRALFPLPWHRFWTSSWLLRQGYMDQWEKAGSEPRTSKSKTLWDSGSFLSKYKAEVITDQMCHWDE